MTRARSSHVDVMRQRSDVAIQRRRDLVRDQVNSVADTRDNFMAGGSQQELLRHIRIMFLRRKPRARPESGIHILRSRLARVSVSRSGRFRVRAAPLIRTGW